MSWDIGAVEYGASPSPLPTPTTPPSETPAPGYPPPGSAGPGGSDDIAPIAVRASGGAVFILARLFLDSGTEYEAKRQIVVDDDHVYEARVKEFGFVDRSIPVPSGLPQLGDCKIVIVGAGAAYVASSSVLVCTPPGPSPPARASSVTAGR